jgi:hypothetical protein
MIEKRDGLISLLKKYIDFFAWSYADIPSLDTNIVVHEVSLLKGSKPIKHKSRWKRSYMLLKVKAEIQVGCKILGCSPLPPMGDQYSSGSQEIWQDQGMCRLQRFE